jgi:hypothetical protein
MKRLLAMSVALVALCACTKTVTVTVPSPVPATTTAIPSTLPSGVPATGIPTAVASGPTTSPTPTKVLPLDQARVEGKFRGKGFGNIQPTITPKCSKGPCGVVAHGGKHGYKFAFKQGAYTANANTTSQCGTGSESFQLNAHVMVKFHVAKAKYIGDEWRATAISSVTVDQIQGAHKTFGNSILTCHSVHSTERGTLFLQGNQG